MIFPVQYLALFHLFHWSVCIASTKCQNRVQEQEKCSHWEYKRECGCSDRMMGKKSGPRGCLRVYFELYYPYYRRVSALHSLNVEGAGGPPRKAPINLCMAIHLSIYSSAHLMTNHPVWSTFLLPLAHLSDNHSINTSICAPIQQFMHPCVHLCVIHPPIHPSTHPSIHLPRRGLWVRDSQDHLKRSS